MQYTWSSPAAPAAGSRLVTVLTAASALLLSLIVAASTITADWVPGTAHLTTLVLAGFVVALALALARPLPSALGLAAWLAALPLALTLVLGPEIAADYPGAGISLATLFSHQSVLGDASDSAVFLYVLGAAAWFLSGWLTWCVIRWRQALLGLMPAAAMLATNILNYPANQNGFVLAFLVLALLLLLWTSYQRSLLSAGGHGIALGDDVRTGFWRAGSAVLVAVVLASLLLPPLSRVDHTVGIETGPIRSWADLLDRLNHPLVQATGLARGNSSGLSLNVPLGGPMRRTRALVLLYTVDSPYSGPQYFRAFNLVGPAAGSWRYWPYPHLSSRLTGDRLPAYSEQYRAQAVANFTITIVRPPAVAPGVVMYPGQLERIDRDTIGLESLVPSQATLFDTLDRLDTRTGQPPGTYHVTITYSTASEAQLSSAGAAYPAWTALYTYLPGLGPAPVGAALGAGLPRYRSPAVLARVRALAEAVTASAANPYDKASAIERFLRSQFTYSLAPPAPPAGMDPLEFFLFYSRVGYCEYFATAMGDMLRSLGIPTRLVNGYSGGIYDQPSKQFIIREDDAHTWVEVYFPHYGWIPFEPTPDESHVPIRRGVAPGSACVGENACQGGAGDLAGKHHQAGGAAVPPGAGHASSRVASFRLGWPSLPSAPWSPFLAVLALLGLLAVAAMAAAWRFLQPATVGQVWRRTAALARLAGVKQGPGETPLEYGGRLADAFPDLAEPLRVLAGDFALAAYAPPALALGARSRVLESWPRLRVALLRRIVREARERR